MLKTIADASPQLVTFILALRLSLSRPQLQHVTQVAAALITTEGSKTLSALYRNIVGDPCPKSAADTFREAPWEADVIRLHRDEHARRLLVEACRMVLEVGNIPDVLARFTLAPAA